MLCSKVVSDSGLVLLIEGKVLDLFHHLTISFPILVLYLLLYRGLMSKFIRAFIDLLMLYHHVVIVYYLCLRPMLMLVCIDLRVSDFATLTHQGPKL